MRKNIIKIILGASFGIMVSIVLVNYTKAAGCDIKRAIFSPNGAQSDLWFDRSDRPTFSVQLVGNGECGGQTIQAELVNHSILLGGRYSTAGRPQGGITFNQGSNVVTLSVKAGEFTCSPSPAKDCQMSMRITTSVGTFNSTDISGKPQGYIIYDCDDRFTLCDQSIRFEFLGISGGRIGAPTVANTICGYTANDGVWACVNNSNQKAVENKCSEVAECNGKECKSIDTALCRTRAFNYGCVTFDTNKNANIYACSPGNKSDCSDASSCAGKQCTQVKPASLCGTVVGSPDGHGGAPVNFELQNPLGLETFQDLVRLVGRAIFDLAIPIAVILIIYAGFLMITSGAPGAAGNFKKGGQIIYYVSIGLAVIFIGRGFVTLIKSILDVRN